MSCPACDGAAAQDDYAGVDCATCGGDGTVTVEACPLRVVGTDVWELLRFCDMADRGFLPRRGGLLDQTQSFYDAMNLCAAEESRVRASVRKGLFNGGQDDEE
jgi:hypothetical protein